MRVYCFSQKLCPGLPRTTFSRLLPLKRSFTPWRRQLKPLSRFLWGSMPDNAPPQKKGLWIWLRLAATPPPVDDAGGLPQWRERMFFFTLGPGLLLGLVAYLLALPMLVKESHYLVMVLDSVMLGLSLAVFLLRRLPLAVRMVFLLSLIYILGLAILINIGPLSSGPFWLFAIPLLCAMYLGRRPVLVALALNLATLLVLNWVLSQRPGGLGRASGQIRQPLAGDNLQFFACQRGHGPAGGDFGARPGDVLGPAAQGGPRV